MPTARKATKVTPEDKVEVEFPDLEAWKVLVSSQKLTLETARPLYHTLREVVSIVSTHQANVKKHGSRKKILGARKRLQMTLEKLLRELQCCKRFADQYLPNASLHALGEMISDSEFEDAINKKLPPIDLRSLPSPPGLGPAVLPINEPSKTNVALIIAKLAVSPAGNSTSSLRISDIERHRKFDRQARGLKHGPRLLEHFIRRVYDPLTDWIEFNRHSKGGKPLDYVRWLVVMALANYCEKVLKVRATATPKGKFLTLCTDVLYAMKVPVEGLGEAAQRILAERRRRKADVN